MNYQTFLINLLKAMCTCNIPLTFIQYTENNKHDSFIIQIKSIFEDIDFLRKKILQEYEKIDKQ